MRRNEVYIQTGGIKTVGSACDEFNAYKRAGKWTIDMTSIEAIVKRTIVVY